MYLFKFHKDGIQQRQTNQTANMSFGKNILAATTQIPIGEKYPLRQHRKYHLCQIPICGSAARTDLYSGFAVIIKGISMQSTGLSQTAL